MKLAIIDIETTGAHNCGNKITELAILLVEDGKVSNSYHSLFNPEMTIPRPITALTGIDKQVVNNAPEFKDLAQEINEFIKGHVFIAHQVNFDYNFIKAEMGLADIPFSRKRLCTVRYARRIVKGLRSYSLSALCRHFNIKNTDPHRAMGDARATHELLLRLFEMDKDLLVFEELVKQSDHAAILPAHLNSDNFEELPAAPGVYYLLDQNRRPVYIGKAINLQKRVLSHFTGSSKNSRKQLFQREVFYIDHKETADIYIASLLEDKEIKTFWPRHNRAQKEISRQMAVSQYQDRLGRMRLGITRFTPATANILSVFSSYPAARQWLFSKCVEFNIDPALAGLPPMNDYNTIDDNEFNESGIKELYKECTAQLDGDTLILNKIPKSKLCTFIYLRKGSYAGFGEIAGDCLSYEEVDKNLNPAPASAISGMVIRQLLCSGKAKIHKISVHV